MTHTASVNCVPRTNLLVSVFLSFKIYAHISTWKLIPFLLHEKRHTLVWSMNWQSRVRAKKNRKFPARSDLSLHIQKVRTPGKDRHQHCSNCLERNNNNRCICVIHSYDMSLSLCLFENWQWKPHVYINCFRSKGFYKDQPCFVKNVGHLRYHSHLMGFLCVMQSHTNDRTAVARNGG